MTKEKWIDNGQPDKFPEPEDGWAQHPQEEWIDNGQPGDFPSPDDGWL